MIKCFLVIFLVILPIFSKAADADAPKHSESAEDNKNDAPNPLQIKPADEKSASPVLQGNDAASQSTAPAMPQPYPGSQVNLPVLPTPETHGAPNKIAENASIPIYEPYEIYFENNSVKLDINAKQLIKKAADDFIKIQPRKVVVGGHTDRTGSLQHNMYLAGKRAREVAKLLIKQGIPENNIDIRSYGESASWLDQMENYQDEHYRSVEIIFVTNNKATTK
jgi:hypothetical protein